MRFDVGRAEEIGINILTNLDDQRQTIVRIGDRVCGLMRMLVCQYYNLTGEQRGLERRACSQHPQHNGAPVRWYRDRATATHMPGRVMSSKLVLWITIILLICILGMVLFLKLR